MAHHHACVWSERELNHLRFRIQLAQGQGSPFFCSSCCPRKTRRCCLLGYPFSSSILALTCWIVVRARSTWSLKVLLVSSMIVISAAFLVAARRRRGLPSILPWSAKTAGGRSSRGVLFSGVRHHLKRKLIAQIYRIIY